MSLGIHRIVLYPPVLALKTCGVGFFFSFPLRCFVESADGVLHAVPQLTWASGSFETFSKDSSARNNTHMHGACVPLECRRRRFEGPATSPSHLRLLSKGTHLRTQEGKLMPPVPAPWSSLRQTCSPHYRRTAVSGSARLTHRPNRLYHLQGRQMPQAAATRRYSTNNNCQCLLSTRVRNRI